MCTKKSCAYSQQIATHRFLSDHRQAQGCPGGPKCKRYKPVNARERKVPQMPSTFKKDRSGLFTAFESMYEEGFSDQQIADALGVSKEMVAKWRRAERLPSRETRRQIMAAHDKANAILSARRGGPVWPPEENTVSRTEAPE